jgi:glutamate dehydrogenase
MSPSDVWERLLVDGLARDFQQMRLDFLRSLMGRKGAKDDPLAAVAPGLRAMLMPWHRCADMITRAQSRPPVVPAMLAQIASQARNLLDR